MYILYTSIYIIKVQDRCENVHLNQGTVTPGYDRYGRYGTVGTMVRYVGTIVQ